MAKWDYKRLQVLYLHGHKHTIVYDGKPMPYNEYIDGVLSQLGTQGWELVDTLGFAETASGYNGSHTARVDFFFKRPAT